MDSFEVYALVFCLLWMRIVLDKRRFFLLSPEGKQTGHCVWNIYGQTSLVLFLH